MPIPTPARVSNRFLLAATLLFAFMPLALLFLMVTFRLPAFGGLFFNPVTVAAYVWLVLTASYYRRTRSSRAKWLFALFPIAFAVPFWFVLFWLWGQSGRP